MWVTLGPFCAMRYIRSSEYLLGDKKSRERRRLSLTERNVAFKCAVPRSRADYRKVQILHVVTPRNIKAEKELPLNHAMKYSF